MEPVLFQKLKALRQLLNARELASMDSNNEQSNTEIERTIKNIREDIKSLEVFLALSGTEYPQITNEYKKFETAIERIEKQIEAMDSVTGGKQEN